MPRKLSAFLAAFILSLCGCLSATASDWPMWRYDAGRTAASANELPDELKLAWTRTGTPREQAWDDPLNLDLMSYDRLFEPIVLDGRMFVGHSDRDKLSAIDTKTGQELWSFFTDAPVRLPPVGYEGAVYFSSDDGKLYCVDGETGKLRWQFDGIPAARKVIGNRRIISAWPSRGGVVLKDGNLYFATSIWPFMGVFIYSLDAKTGQVVWVNDSTGASYIKQPHSAPAFAGVAPQGALVATEKDLIVPGGRSVPAVLDRATGKLRYFELNAGGKGTGGSFVAATDESFYVHTRLKGTREFNLKDGKKTSFTPNEPVLHGDLVYTAEESKGKPVIKAYNSKRKVEWEIEADGRGDLILAGDKLFAAGPDGLFAVRLPAKEGDEPKLVWQAKTNGEIERLLAASGMLFAVTQDGHIHAYAAKADKPVVHQRESKPLPVAGMPTVPAETLLKAGDTNGYALWFGAASESTIHALAQQSPFVQLAVVDGDAKRVDQLRRNLDQAGLYGKVTAHQASPASFDAAPYLAHMIFVGEELAPELTADKEALAKVYNSLRPYGGTMQLLAAAGQQAGLVEAIKAAELEKAEVETGTGVVIVRRVGALPDSAQWTHLHGDIGNTRKSNDARVKLPLGILWFGGSSNMDVLPRHGHGPSQQVVDGRLYIQGINKLSARDVYTGRVLWIREFEDLGTYDVYYDKTYKETPLDPSYNQVHIPGANARGTNFVVTSERIYIVEGAVCHVLDPSTGKNIQTIELPQDDPKNPREWSYIGVYGDTLIGGLGFARYRDRLKLDFEQEDGKLSGSKAGFGSKALDRAGSLALVGFDRMTGKERWRVDARHSFWNNGIVAGNGNIYCLDRNPSVVEDKLRRRGMKLPEYRILAVDAQTGQEAWQVEKGVFGTWLGYSDKHDLLLQAGAKASDRLAIEVDKGMTVFQGKTGEIVWDKPDLSYSGPCILHNDLIITNANSYRESAGAYVLKTGEPHTIVNPLTGEEEIWKIKRAYGCNTILASENLLTFRSGAAGFYDLNNHSGTGNFGGFRSGCTGNLIAADGVLNAPDYTRTCSCSYQNQTSLALVHMPELKLETWTLNNFVSATNDNVPVKMLGINFGAPGHQRDADGKIWIEWPLAASDSSPISIVENEKAAPYLRHSSIFADSEYPWVFASGIEGPIDLQIGTRINDSSKDKRKAKPDEKAEPLNYRVRLFFGLPRGASEPERRRFDVLIDGKIVAADVELVEGDALTRELPNIKLGETFRLQVRPKTGTPVLSGVELQRVD